MVSNVAVLTRSQQIVAAKKRQKREQVKEITFDDDARREFLTGFHKRKLAKKEEGKEKAKLREKNERLEARREQRRMLAEKAAENAAQVEKAYGGTLATDDDDWAGFGSSSKPTSAPPEAEAEFSDEEQMATVTVVEDFDPSSLIHGTPPDLSQDVSPSAPHPNAKGKGRATRDHEGDGAPSLKPGVKSVKAAMKQVKSSVKKIKYEGKSARLREQSKQRARRTEKAERAGGKASRKKTGQKKRR
ncbi:hypothetical protein FA95DRAFT_1554767 [Auriscalpium vulgare]|uniref:Uncharacterized protein n=1 Tax=Auriscalpium vulgare TaxID=40419 RepID=A0ACB8S413_9AGAM|nr:hypothetical protein FA95DRAFT_1554767 [Auriscalpium vulgare]